MKKLALVFLILLTLIFKYNFSNLNEAEQVETQIEFENAKLTIEVTPKNIRMRKSILDEDERKRVSKMMKTEVA